MRAHLIAHGTPLSPQFSAHVCCAKRLDGSKYHLVPGYATAQAALCYMGIQLPQKGRTANFQSMSIVAKRSPIATTAEHLLKS